MSGGSGPSPWLAPGLLTLTAVAWSMALAGIAVYLRAPPLELLLERGAGEVLLHYALLTAITGHVCGISGLWCHPSLRRPGAVLYAVCGTGMLIAAVALAAPTVLV